DHRFRDLLARFGGRLKSLYEGSLAVLLDRPAIPIIAAIVLAVGSIPLYRSLDQELMPPEDRGAIQVDAAGPDGVGIGYMDRQTQTIEEMLQPLVDNGEAESLFTIIGTW